MFIVAGLAAAALAWWALNSPGAPPLYEGKPLDQWLDAGYEDCARVLYEAGPPAVDAVFSKLKREHPRYGRWGRYRSAWQKCPAFCQKLLPRPRASGFDEWRACNALLAIGPQAIPSLRTSIRDRHFLVRAVSAQALGLLQQRGANIRSALPALQVALRDRDPAVRHQAAFALGLPDM